jgi:hypothetical protein
MVVDLGIVGAERRRLFELGDGIGIAAEAIIGPAEAVDDVTVVGRGLHRLLDHAQRALQVHAFVDPGIAEVVEDLRLVGVEVEGLEEILLGQRELVRPLVGDATDVIEAPVGRGSAAGDTERLGIGIGSGLVLLVGAQQIAQHRDGVDVGGVGGDDVVEAADGLGAVAHGVEIVGDAHHRHRLHGRGCGNGVIDGIGHLVLAGLIVELAEDELDGVVARVEVGAEAEQHHRHVGGAVAGKGDAHRMEHLGRARLGTVGIKAGPLPGDQRLLDLGDDGMGQALGLELRDGVEPLLGLAGVAHDAGIGLDDVGRVGIGVVRVGDVLDGDGLAAGHVGHDGAMEDEEVLEAAIGELVERAEGVVDLVLAGQGPGLEDRAGDALEGLRVDLVEVAHGGIVAALPEGLGAEHEPRHVVAGFELEHVPRHVGGGVDLAVGGQREEGVVDHQRIVPLVGGGGTEELRCLMRAQITERLLTGKVIAGGAVGALERRLLGEHGHRKGHREPRGGDEAHKDLHEEFDLRGNAVDLSRKDWRFCDCAARAGNQM